jgi:exosome complex RNA-binding protein Rrp42 (RNase PH superfamily)
MFQLTSVPVLSDAVVTFFSSIVVLNPNGQFLGCATIALAIRLSDTKKYAVVNNIQY